MTLISRRLACQIALALPGLALSAPAIAQGAEAGGSAKAGAAPALGASPTNPLGTVKSWGYQLQGVDIGAIARSPLDLLVIDYSRNGEEKGRFSRGEIQRLRRKPDGSRRVVLAYLSIGEAEDYRYYWDDTWIETATPDAEPPAAGGAMGQAKAGAGAAPSTASPAPPALRKGEPATEPAKPDRWLSSLAPTWLGDENDAWSGNFQVKYWEAEWQAILFGSPQSYLERILSQGFDGVYLDRADAFYEFADERSTAAADMIDLVEKVAARARALKPGAIVVVQNAEELLLEPRFVAAIDGIAKEDMLFGSPTEGQPNSPAQIANSDSWLSHATGAGRPVLAIEYLDKPETIREARAGLQRRGFIPTVGPRTLDKLVLSAAVPPALAVPSAVAGAGSGTAAERTTESKASEAKRRRSK